VPEVFRIDRDDPAVATIRRAADLVRRGLVIAYPTDTVYGLAVDPRNAAAVRRLFGLKGRPETSALTLIASNIDQVQAVAEITEEGARLAAQFWPGPLTIVFCARPGIAVETLAGGTTVGVRVPDDAVARALAREAGFCVTATSANRTGQPAASSAGAVVEALPGVDGILDAGESCGGAASTIVDASTAAVTLIRAGAIAWDRVLKSLSSGA